MQYIIIPIVYLIWAILWVIINILGYIIVIIFTFRVPEYIGYQANVENKFRDSYYKPYRVFPSSFHWWWYKMKKLFKEGEI